MTVSLNEQLLTSRIEEQGMARLPFKERCHMSVTLTTHTHNDCARLELITMRAHARAHGDMVNDHYLLTRSRIAEQSWLPCLLKER